MQALIDMAHVICPYANTTRPVSPMRSVVTTID
ncbi:hypothetical protein LMG28138_00057 [Pararobbsia alpina]|uniref:Uncharacterized protein n=1 Tax=Pararobbsia alpina TaxID=621374 RepID=A0A6S7AUF9_9BURK|nr:hypothetical protein LMG28138_00057 [Pararobbsia alpina]